MKNARTVETTENKQQKLRNNQNKLEETGKNKLHQKQLNRWKDLEK